MTTEDEEALELEELPEAVPILPLKKYRFISWGGNSHHGGER